MFTGSLVALITPFKNGSVDEKGFEKFVAWQIKEGTDGLVPCGTTGESPTLSMEEHKRVIDICISAAKGSGVPVIAGTGSNSTAEAIELTQHAKNAGADAAMLVVPYYNKPTQEGLFQHFKAVAEAVDIPILLYNVPPRTGGDMQVETVIRLSQVRNIVGIKDASYDMARPTLTRLKAKKGFVQLSGEDASALGFRGRDGRVDRIDDRVDVAPGPGAGGLHGHRVRGRPGQAGVPVPAGRPVHAQAQAVGIAFLDIVQGVLVGAVRVPAGAVAQHGPAGGHAFRVELVQEAAGVALHTQALDPVGADGLEGAGGGGGME